MEPDNDRTVMAMTEDLLKSDIEVRLREVLAWGRARAAELRTSDPVEGRAASLIVTHVEDALRILFLPVP